MDDQGSKARRNPTPLLHDADGRFIIKHGHSNSPTHVSWNAMVNRCTNKNSDRYEEYGARGIAVCERWLTFENFLADMGERPAGKTLDRFPDRDGDYEPTNCRWATPLEQSHNRSTTRLTGELAREIRDRRKRGESVVAIARDIGIAYGTVYGAAAGHTWKEIS